MTTAQQAANATDAGPLRYWLTEEEKTALVESQAYEQGSLVAQIFSGIFFTGVAGWLTLSNGTRLAFVQRAALEKRLTTCCFLSTYVAFFSCFFNYFQLTAVDDLVLPEPNGESNYTLDLARPCEWIMTCPLMQLSLVLMGGAKIPEYRRYLMPAFSAVILALGTLGAFAGATIFAIKAICWTISCMIFCVMVYFNRLQIIEYSNGQEGLIQGDSEFRKATVLLIATWSPFPFWYVISPEGLGLIGDPLFIQVGWAFLNIVAKFSFIFYIQRCKDMYCNRLKTKRELQPSRHHGASSGRMGMPMPMFHGMMSPPFGDDGMMMGNAAQELENEEIAKKKAQLAAVVVETMNFLGMAQHTDRLIKLLDSANMNSIFEVEGLTKDQCAELQLPHELISALQRRLKVWKLEMVDDAEMGLDKGEEFYIKKGADMPMDGMDGMLPGMFPMFDPEEQNQKLQTIEDLLRQKLGAEETILHESRSTGELVERSNAGIIAQFQAAMEQMETRLLEKLETTGRTNESSLTKDAVSQRSEVRAFEQRITAKLDELATMQEQQRRHELHTLESRLNAGIEQQVATLSTKIDVCCQKVEGTIQKVDVCSQKVDSCSAEQNARIVESFSRFSERFDEATKQSAVAVEALGRKVDGGFAKVGSEATAVQESLDSFAAQTRSGLEFLTTRAEAIQAAQAKIAAASEDSWRQRINELESNMICREDEQRSIAKRHFDELVREKPTRKLEEVVTHLQKLSDQVEQAKEALGASLASEIHAASSKAVSKTENAQGALTRIVGEADAANQRRLDDTMAQVQSSGAQLAQRLESMAADLQKRLDAAAEASLSGAKGVESVVQKRIEQLEFASQATADKSSQKTAALLETLRESISKRLEETIQKSATDCAHVGAISAERRAEKAMESLEAATRTELHAATTSLLERFDDIQAAQARKAGEREERNMRRVEELLELVATRATQKTEDVGMDVKKELHGFAKRLNSKIPFM